MVCAKLGRWADGLVGSRIGGPPLGTSVSPGSSLDIPETITS